VLSTGTGGGKFDYVPGYTLLLTSYTFGLATFWFVCLGIGMLYLRFFTNWKKKSPVPHPVGVAAAIVFTVLNLFPFICVWIPDTTHYFLALSKRQIPWYLSQTLVFAVFSASLLYWLAFRFYLHRKKTREGLVLDVIRQPLFTTDENGRDLIQAYEIIKLDWTAYESDETEKRASRATFLSGFGGSHGDGDAWDRRASTIQRSSRGAI
jgi:hypothetical protein